MQLYALVQVFEDEVEMFLGVFDTRTKAVRAAKRYMGDSKDMEFAIHNATLNPRDLTPVVSNCYVTANGEETRTHPWC